MTTQAGSAPKTEQKNSGRPIPVSLANEETRYKVLTELIKAEEYYVSKIRSARHSIAHEILSDSSAIIGAATTLSPAYFKSLIAVSPIVGMLIWERAQAKKDLKRLHRVAELFRKTRDPQYFHVLGLELEGIPRTEDLTREQRKKVEQDINEILKKPVSFGSSLKNLRDDDDGDTAPETNSIGQNIVNGSKATAHFLWETVVDLKNLKTLPKNYLMAAFVIAKQSKTILAKPINPLSAQFAAVAGKAKDWFKKPEPAPKEDLGKSVARVVRSQTATFATDPAALVREVKRVKDSLRRAAIESSVNGVAFVCQTAFVVNQGLVTHHHLLQDQWLAAAGVALPSLLALSPLNYFAKNQIDKYNQMRSDRAHVAKRLEQRAKTLHAVNMVKRMISAIHKEEDEDKHLKMAQELVGMFGDDFNPEWFEKEQRDKLKNLFELVAANDNRESVTAAPDTPEPEETKTEQESDQQQPPAPQL